MFTRSPPEPALAPQGAISTVAHHGSRVAEEHPALDHPGGDLEHARLLTVAEQHVARAGNSGGEKESALYFEIRKNGNPIDPLPWLNK